MRSAHPTSSQRRRRRSVVESRTCGLRADTTNSIASTIRSPTLSARGSAPTSRAEGAWFPAQGAARALLPAQRAARALLPAQRAARALLPAQRAARALAIVRVEILELDAGGLGEAQDDERRDHQ